MSLRALLTVISILFVFQSAAYGELSDYWEPEPSEEPAPEDPAVVEEPTPEPTPVETGAVVCEGDEMSATGENFADVLEGMDESTEVLYTEEEEQASSDQYQMRRDIERVLPLISRQESLYERRNTLAGNYGSASSDVSNLLLTRAQDIERIPNEDARQSIYRSSYAGAQQAARRAWDAVIDARSKLRQMSGSLAHAREAYEEAQQLLSRNRNNPTEAEWNLARERFAVAERGRQDAASELAELSTAYHSAYENLESSREGFVQLRQEIEAAGGCPTRITWPTYPELQY